MEEPSIKIEFYNSYCTTCRTWLVLYLVTDEERRDAGPLTEMCALCRLRHGTTA